MKEITFPYSISFGKWSDSESGSIKLALSDKDAKRLVRSAEEGGRHSLDEDQFISDICAKVYKAVDKALIDQLLKDPSPVRASLQFCGMIGKRKNYLLEMKAYGTVSFSAYRFIE